MYLYIYFLAFEGTRTTVNYVPIIITLMLRQYVYVFVTIKLNVISIDFLQRFEVSPREVVGLFFMWSSDLREIKCFKVERKIFPVLSPILISNLLSFIFTTIFYNFMTIVNDKWAININLFILYMDNIVRHKIYPIVNLKNYSI